MEVEEILSLSIKSDYIKDENIILDVKDAIDIAFTLDRIGTYQYLGYNYKSQRVKR